MNDGKQLKISMKYYIGDIYEETTLSHTKQYQ